MTRLLRFAYAALLAWTPAPMVAADTSDAVSARPGAAAGQNGPSIVAGAGSAMLLSEIRQTIGQAFCESDAQCHTIGVGSSPCGGPEAYWSWSDRDTDAIRLAALVAQYAKARRTEDEVAGVQSTCRAITDPGAACRPRTQDHRKACTAARGGGV